MALTYLTDGAGNRTAVVIDIESWNSYVQMYPDVLYRFHENTFSEEYNKKNRKPGTDMFGNSINLLGTENFSVDGTEN